MRVLIVADGRSPTARRWSANLAANGVQIHLLSTFPCQPLEGTIFEEVIPVAFSQFAGSGHAAHAGAPVRHSVLAKLIHQFRGMFLVGRYWLGPLSIQLEAHRLAAVIARVQPDLVHALRIPFEGLLAAAAQYQAPLALSIWGNDLTLHAKGSPWMRVLTQKALQRAGGLAADARRDLRLGKLWGFAPGKPELVVPGAGGIALDEINQVTADRARLSMPDIPTGALLVINARGFRPGSVRNDTFFNAIPIVLEQAPQTCFVCPAMAGQTEAERWANQLHMPENLRLLPVLPQRQLWQLFKQCAVFVSPSAHDGTPNSLLEAMACGCFPVAGDIESLRQWITPGVNGLLVDPDNPRALAEAILLALNSPQNRQRAALLNSRLVEQQANAGQLIELILQWYHSVINFSQAG